LEGNIEYVNKKSLSTSKRKLNTFGTALLWCSDASVLPSEPPKLVGKIRIMQPKQLEIAMPEERC
jgi:hypothetical protein